jgi:hypothetical protein
MSGSDGINKLTQRLPTIVTRLVALAASPAGFAAAVGLTVLRHVLAPLMLDFKDGLYLPTVAFFAGRDPYSAAYLAEYGAVSPFPYPPHALLLFYPFTLLPYGTATVVYLVFALAMIVTIAHLAVRLAGVDRSPSWLWGAATALLLSRPGHMAVVEGQPSLMVIVATLLVLDERTRAWVRTAALALTTIKPTFGGPLFVLTFVRGAWRETLVAGAIALLCAVAPTLALVNRTGGLGPFVAELRTNQAEWLKNPDNDPAISLYRIDTPALLSRALDRRLPSPVEAGLTALLLGVGAITLRRRTARLPGPDAIALGLGAATVLACIYHQTYDLLLLAPVAVALAAGGGSRVLLAMLAVAGHNNFATNSLIERLGLTMIPPLLVTSWNGLTVLAVFAYFFRLARSPRVW